MSNEAQRLYSSLSEQAKGHADQLLRYAWERDQAIAQRDALLVAAKPFKEFADYLLAHPRTGLADELYGWDNEVFLRQSDLLKLREAAIAAAEKA